MAADEGFAARLRTTDSGLVDSVGGAEAYDGGLTTALAAVITGDDGRASLHAGWSRVISEASCVLPEESA